MKRQKPEWLPPGTKRISPAKPGQVKRRVEEIEKIVEEEPRRGAAFPPSPNRIRPINPEGLAILRESQALAKSDPSELPPLWATKAAVNALSKTHKSRPT
jgi:hypothetical protein